MNHFYTNISGAGSADAVSTRAFLQQAVDHYPRLAVFSFTLKLPYRETLNDYRSLILRFHTEVWQRTGKYSRQRQQARRLSPPTVLRWLWEAVSEPECGMIMLMNLDTMAAVSNTPLMESVLQEMYTIFGDAWRTVAGTDSSVASMSSFIINRSNGGECTHPLSLLQTRVNEMVSPVMTTRTGVVCP